MTTNRTERIRKELIEFANLLCETEKDVKFCESARHHVYNAISELVKAHNELVDFEIARLNDLSQNVTHDKVKE